MAEKKYYWLKLKRDFFKRHDVRIIEAMPNGKDYILFYLKMLLESIDHDGMLRFSDAIPYDENMLSVITNTNIDVVRTAMKVFIELKMLEVFDDRTIYMSEVEKLIGSESASAERVRKHRNEQKLLQCNVDVTKCNIEIEKEIEQDKEFHSFSLDEKETAKREFMGGTLGGGIVLMSDEQFGDLCNKLSLDELHHYFDVIKNCELKGKKFTNKTHYQAILDMVAKDRTVKNKKKATKQPKIKAAYDLNEFEKMLNSK